MKTLLLILSLFLLSCEKEDPIPPSGCIECVEITSKDTVKFCGSSSGVTEFEQRLKAATAKYNQDWNCKQVK